jgi:hypothetical protein
LIVPLANSTTLENSFKILNFYSSMYVRTVND